MVTHALLYWGARAPQQTADMQITVEREGVFSANVAAAHSNTTSVNTLYFYQSVADLSDLVAMHGSGSYRISGLYAGNLVDNNLNSSYAGWSLVVFYELATDPFRSLAIFDGLDTVADMSPQSAMIAGVVLVLVNRIKTGEVLLECQNGVSYHAIA
jgi:hypothetical protein